MKIKLPKTDRLLGISAMIISILTLIIFIQQTNIINRQSKLSVKPHLSFGTAQTTNDSVASFTQYVKNKGLGPAIVKDAKIIFNDEKYPFDFDQFIFTKYPDIEKYGNLVSTSTISHYSIISPNESLIIYKINVPLAQVAQIAKYLEIDPIDIVPKWNFEIEYTSMYEDEVWKIEDVENKPVKN